MSKLVQLLSALAPLATQSLPPGFELSALPPTGDGERFELRYRGDNWDAGVVGTIRWRGLVVQYSPSGFGSYLVRHAEEVLTTEEPSVILERTGIQKAMGLIDLWVNGHSVAVADPTGWPRGWRDFEIRVTFSPFDARDGQGNPDLGEIVPRMESVLALLGNLIPPLFTQQFVEDRLEGVPDGARTRVEVNRYERDPRNRTACIAAHGTKCIVCELHLESRYGRLGAGFIHVHHKTPVSTMQEPRLIDPVEDLVPVCPNCHAMLHRQDPPLTIEALKAQLR